MFALITLHQLVIVALAGVVAVVVMAYLLNLRERIVDRRRFIGEGGAILDKWDFDRLAKVVRAVSAGDHTEARRLVEELCEDYLHAPDKDELVLAWLWPNLLYQLPKRLNPKRALFLAEAPAIIKMILDCPEAKAEVMRQLGDAK